MKPEKRMALLKELVKIKPGGTINEQRRARALLRSLAQGRDYSKSETKDGRSYQTRKRPAVGRGVVTTKFSKNARTTDIYDISFYGNNGVQDQPFKGGLKDSKLKALNYMLGQALDKDVPKNNMIKIDATDDRRVKAYTRGTKGALKFQPFDFNLGELELTTGGTAKSYKNKAGNFQPIVKGKFTKSVPNPGDHLRSGLIRAATAAEPTYRAIQRILSLTRPIGADPINAIMTGADIGKWMRNNLKVNKQSSGRGGGRQALND